MPPEKICATCGRSFAWRKKWERNWNEVVHCSDRCRSRRTGDAGKELETRILALLATRARGTVVELSEVTHELRETESVHAAARRLAHRGVIDLLHRGVVVEPDRAGALVQLRLRTT